MHKFFDAFPTYISVIGSVGLFREVKLSESCFLCIVFPCAPCSNDSIIFFICIGGSPRMALLCQFLGRTCRSNAIWVPEPSELLAQLKTSTGASNAAGSSNQLLHVCVLVFRVANGLPLNREQQVSLLAALARATDDGTVENATSTLEPWLVYQLASQASRHRQAAFAAELFEQLASLVSDVELNVYTSAFQHYNR